MPLYAQTRTLTVHVGIPGGTGSILVSRLSTAWHLAASAAPASAGAGVYVDRSSHPRQDRPTPRTVMLILLLVAMPVALVYFFVLYVSGWLAASFSFSMLALIFLCIVVSYCAPTYRLLFSDDFLQIILSLAVAYFITNYLSKRGYDPDMYVLPIHSAVTDLVGELLLVTCFELASAIGLHVRSHSSS